MARITIFWTLYEPIIPDVIILDRFNEIRSSNYTKLFKVKFVYWRLLKYKILYVSFTIFLLIGDSNNWFPKLGWKAELLHILFILVFLTAIFVLIDVILSSISYVNSYLESKQYEKKFNWFLFECPTYKSFCNSMTVIDKRYVMHIQRMKNESGC